ncbi:DNA polymerase III epsilon subunit and related 3'-5' exonuclease [Paramagnetospirillum magneticum AMB-1]|uniref:DNA polymerase III epsilon subunit and related 3'-5' exonuclease n=2 Tax=Paramagnetospirillum magneticum TaxID=84159 RepID=Q2W5J8_PARM1|nr:DNA polymerase III epsilon subunit and related 3'-5' exonuclease [Paramagnetospirillum magneticum AMB-1]
MSPDEEERGMQEMGDHEKMAVALEATGQYRVLRKLIPRQNLVPHDGSKTRLGIFIDLETTGLDPAKDEIIELAMVPFVYGLDGRIFEIQDAFQGLRQPSNPIPAEITKLTGITDEMVAGKVIDPAEVAAFAAPAAIVIAHNAAFDRKFIERFCPSFSTKPWGCSMSQVDWTGEGFEGTKLGYLLGGFGLFHDGHRATDDCHAAIEILARPLPKSGVPAMGKLLEKAREATCRVWAENSPFDLKDVLKARGYRWSDGSDGRPRAWFIDVPEDQLQQEKDFLVQEIYQREVDIHAARITAVDRFSIRC